MNIKDKLKKTAWDNHFYTVGTKDVIYSWGYDDAWRDLTARIKQIVSSQFPKQSEQIIQAISKEE